MSLDAIAGTYANHTLRLTTRQTFQFHWIVKEAIEPTSRPIASSPRSGLPIPITLTRGTNDPTRSLEGWVLGIARKRAIDHLRRDSGANIFVNWRALEGAGIDKSARLGDLVAEADAGHVDAIALDAQEIDMRGRTQQSILQVLTESVVDGKGHYE